VVSLGISPGVKAAVAYWLTTYHTCSAERQENPGP